jgi:hypothetical protein
MLVALLSYGYATGTFSSRKLEKASYEATAYRCANTHPDYDTTARFRKRFLKELEGLFVEILLVGQAMGLVKSGTVSLDANKHKALSWAHSNKLQAQLEAEVQALMRLAEASDNASPPEEIDVLQELSGVNSAPHPRRPRQVQEPR